MSSTPQITPVPAKSMAGKYDGRVKANKTRIVKPTGRKPLFAKHLTRNTAAVVLKQVDLKARLLELLTHKDARLRFEVIRYVWDRLEGKPFVAENPNSKAVTNVLNQDNRLQVAIQALVPSRPAAKRSKRSAPPALINDNKQLTSGVIPIIDAEEVSRD